jgi:tetratricopeptide (TPR) repeat protein
MQIPSASLHVTAELTNLKAVTCQCSSDSMTLTSAMQTNDIVDAKASEFGADDAAIYTALATSFRANGQEAEAIEEELASIALGQRNALMLYNLGTSYLMTQRPALAVKWLRLALDIDPTLVPAHQNLASILEMEGSRLEAKHHRDEAYRRQCMFIDEASTCARTVLILCTASTGNVPFDFLLPQSRNRRITWMMEYASIEQVSQLPPYDVVFNAIGDQDVTDDSHETVMRFLDLCDKPVINSPTSIARTSRDLIPDLLNNIDHVLVPPTMRLMADGRRPMDAEQLARAGVHLPMVARPVGSHGGRGMQLLETPAALMATKPGDVEDIYASSYYDYRSADGHYRKYRVIFIDRQPYPYHLAISEHWQVHYTSADMLSHPWKRDEEHRFLENPDIVLGNNAINALKIIGQRIDLDFFGIDFSIMDDGRILIFEANATMLVHTENYHEVLKFKNSYVQRILNAFDALLVNRISLANVPRNSQTTAVKFG